MTSRFYEIFTPEFIHSHRIIAIAIRATINKKEKKANFSHRDGRRA